MSTDKLDDVIGYLMEMKNLKLQLELKDEEIRNYVNLLLTKKSHDFDQSFMIYTYDTDEDAINLICRNFMEFSEIIYDHNYLLIVRKESNRNIGIYLMPFEDACHLETTLQTIEKLIERKIQDSEIESYTVPSTRIVPEVKMINTKMAEMVEKLKESDKDMKDLNEKLNTLDDVNKNIENMKKDMERHSHQLQSVFSQLQIEMCHLKEDINEKDQPFYSQKNLNYVRNSPQILEKMCMRLSVKDYDDDSSSRPPFEYITSMEKKKKELIGYFDLLQKDLNGYREQTEMQKNIKLWMLTNWVQLVYKPTAAEIEEWKKEIKQKLRVQNTIGTICQLTITWYGRENYFFFCIANSKMICWDWGRSKEESLKNVRHNLKNILKWDSDAKFATDMDVWEDYSDYFVHVSTDELLKIYNNQKVIEWITRNFEFLKYSFNDVYHHSLPAIYSLALKYFEEPT